MIEMLVVDDSGIMRHMLIRSLHQAQLGEIVCHEADSVEECIAKVAAGHVDVVFVTDPVGRTTGWELAGVIRSSSNEPPAVVAVVGPDADADQYHRLVRAGAEVLLYKPVQAQTLREQVLPIVSRLARSA
jgi:two-component system chemotaxis response regulator CheY